MSVATTYPTCVIPAVAIPTHKVVKPTTSAVYTGLRRDIGHVQHLVCTAATLGMFATGIVNNADGTFDLEIAGTDETLAAFDELVLARRA